MTKALLIFACSFLFVASCIAIEGQECAIENNDEETLSLLEEYYLLVGLPGRVSDEDFERLETSFI